jgi:hypothetical protein
MSSWKLQIEARHRKSGPQIDRVWHLIGVVLSKYPQMFEEEAGAVYTTLGKWTLEVWDDYLVATQAEGLLEPPTPDYINAIRWSRRPSGGPSSKSKAPAESAHLPANSVGYSNLQSLGQYGDSLPGFDSIASYDLADLLSFEVDPNQWSRWDAAQLLP